MGIFKKRRKPTPTHAIKSLNVGDTLQIGDFVFMAESISVEPHDPNTARISLVSVPSRESFDKIVFVDGVEMGAL